MMDFVYCFLAVITDWTGAHNHGIVILLLLGGAIQKALFGSKPEVERPTFSPR